MPLQELPIELADARLPRMIAETELVGVDAVSEDRRNQRLQLPMIDSLPPSLIAPPARPRLHRRPDGRPQPVIDDQIRRELRQYSRREARRSRRLQRREQLAAQTGTPIGRLRGCYQSFCQFATILLLPLILLLALIGILLFAAFFCLPLLLFFVGLLCMYYCCTDHPIPPRALFRALFLDHPSAAPAAPVTPFGVTLDQVQALMVRRQCLSVETTTTTVTPSIVQPEWGINLLEQQEKHQLLSEPIYWPIGLDSHHQSSEETLKDSAAEEHTVHYYLFSKPLSMTQRELAEHISSRTALDDETELEAVRQVDASDAENGSDTDPASAVEASKPSEGWACCVCTLRNPIGRPYCKSCGNMQGASKAAVVDDDDDDAKRTAVSMHHYEDEVGVREPHPQVNTADELAKRSDDDDGGGEDEVASAADQCSLSHQGALCDICLGDYEAGDVVAWSTNVKCKHAFHVDCITDWLLRRPSCPSCRQAYITIPETMKNDAMERINRIHQRGDMITAEIERGLGYAIEDLELGSSDDDDDDDISFSSTEDSMNHVDELSSVELGSEDNV
jgi:hypothetical protein